MILVSRYANLADVKWTLSHFTDARDDGASVVDYLAPARPSRAGYRRWILKMSSLLALLLTLLWDPLGSISWHCWLRFQFRLLFVLI